MHLAERFIFYRKGNSGSTHPCPGPNHKGNRRRQFTIYVDTETGDLLPDHVGVCNNTLSCGHKYTWWEFLRDNPDYLERNVYTRNASQHRAVIQPQAAPDYFPATYMAKSLTQYQQNNFVRYLESIFPEEVVSNLIVRYRIGTSQSPWSGSVIFWQVDGEGMVRSGKIMLYNPKTGNRVTKPFNHTTWAHALLRKYGKADNFTLQQCLFGEHLLPNSDRVAVVESEKTAIVASVFYPQYVWLATGGKQAVTDALFRPLTGKDVTLFPDKGCFKAWEEKALRLKTEFRRLSVSEVVESLPIDNGGDLADYLPYYVAIPERKQVGKGYPSEWDY